MRFIGVFLVLAIICAAGFAYHVKYNSGRLARDVASLEQFIQQEKDLITGLRAEWSTLNQPARLQALASRHLSDFKTLNVKQMALAFEVPERPVDLGHFMASIDMPTMPPIQAEAPKTVATKNTNNNDLTALINQHVETKTSTPFVLKTQAKTTKIATPTKTKPVRVAQPAAGAPLQLTPMIR